MEAGDRRARRAVRAAGSAPAGRPAPAQERGQRALEAVPRRPLDDRAAPQGVLRRARRAAHATCATRKQALDRAGRGARAARRRRRPRLPRACSTSGSWPAGPARSVDDALWARFKAAGDALYARQGRGRRRRSDEAYRGEPRPRSWRCSTRPSRCSPRRTRAGRAPRSTGIQRSWDEIGAVPRDQVRPVEDRLRKVENARARSLEDEHWQRENPEKKARSEGMLGQLTRGDREARGRARRRPRRPATSAPSRRPRRRRSTPVAPGSRPSAAEPSTLAADASVGIAARVLHRCRAVDRVTALGCRSMAVMAATSRGARHRRSPLAELCAARLDGELFGDRRRLGAGRRARPARVPRGRARALRVPARAHRRALSAAWVHGALDAPPAVAQFCVAARARASPCSRPPARRVREVRIDDDDAACGSAASACTSPVRTGVRPAPRPDARRRRRPSTSSPRCRPTRPSLAARCATGSTRAGAPAARRARASRGSSALEPRSDATRARAAVGLSRR